MRSRSSLLVMMLLGALMAIVAARCSTDNGTNQNIQTNKDAGPKPDGGNPTDGSVEPDAGDVDAGEPDSGTTDPDAGPVDTTVVQINNQQATDHPAAGSKVSFKAVVVAKPYIISKPNSSATEGDCLWGAFVTDATAGAAEYNGLLVTSYGTYDFTSSPKACKPDSLLHTQTALAEGDEIEVTGLYIEFCGGQTPCTDKDMSGADITFPEIAANTDRGSIVRTGQHPGIPSFLPKKVAVGEVYSEGAGPFTVGSKFRQYRGVLVEVDDVVVANTNPDLPNEFCDFTVAANNTTTLALRIADDMFSTYNCDYRPRTTGMHFDSLKGLLYWSFKSAKLLPRSPADGSPAISPGAGVQTDVVRINNLDHLGHPASGSRVSFRAVAASPIWEVSHSGCLFGIFMADRTAMTAEYNGVIVYAKSSKDANNNCAGSDGLPDDVLHKYEREFGSIEFGDEYDVTGTYTEYCYKSGSTCQDQFGGKGISIPEVQLVTPDDFVYSGHPGTLGFTPPEVAPADVYSTRDSGGTITALGANWWKYRLVLVNVKNVKVVNTNPDAAAGKDYCEFGVATTAAPTTVLRVDDAMLSYASTCPHRPAMDTTFSYIKGFVYWANKDSKLLPRAEDDASPALP